MNKFQAKFQNFIKAVDRLEETIYALSLNISVENIDINSLLLDSLILRFKICYELAYKTLREFIIYSGGETGSFPRAILKTAYQNHLIDNQEIWLDMIKDRNVSSHEYNEDNIDEVALRIKNDYFKQFINLIDKLRVYFSLNL